MIEKRVYLLIVLLAAVVGCASGAKTGAPGEPLKSTRQITREQTREVGLQFRTLSDTFITYRFKQWTHLTEKQRYYIENVEWSLINFCTAFASSGISLDSADAGALVSRMTNRMENAERRITGVIDAGKTENEKIMKLGEWAMQFGAAIDSSNVAKVETLLTSYNTTSGSKKKGPLADPAISRKIGLNFSKISDLILAYHYRNWDQLSEARKSNLQNMEMTILNYNSNFGGLGIRVDKEENETLMKRVLAKTAAYVEEMTRISRDAAASYDKIVQLGDGILALGAALTEEDIPAIEKILDEKADGDRFELGRKLGLKLRQIASLLLEYRYDNWDSLDKERQYHLENLEFTLTNFNSDCAVFGVQVEKKALIGRIHNRIDLLIDEMGRMNSGYEKFFSKGLAGVKLGAAILTEDAELIETILASVEPTASAPLDGSAKHLSRNVALKMRMIADKLEKKSIENWDAFTGKERGRLDNIQWTLMNFTSNFSVLGIHLDTPRGPELLQSISETLDRRIKEIGALDVQNRAGKEKLFELGVKSMKTGAVLTTEDIPAIEKLAGRSS